MHAIYNGMMMNTDELMHYGVKGMKWGVRHVDRKLRRALGYNNGKEPSKRDYKRLRKDVARYAKGKPIANKGRRYASLVGKLHMNENTYANIGGWLGGIPGTAIGVNIRRKDPKRKYYTDGRRVR